MRGVIIIAVTASAIKGIRFYTTTECYANCNLGDAELCVQSGMNNYLAKPIRAAVLKSMLESYLNQPPKEITNLEEKTRNMARNIIKEADRTE